MKVLVLSHLMPNACGPSCGVFVVEQLKALRGLGVEATVIAPVPWPPPFLKFLPRVRKFTAIPRRTTIEGFAVEHPRMLEAPNGWLFSLSGIFYYLSCRRLVRRLAHSHLSQNRTRAGHPNEERFDLIHAHTILPDGFAATLLGRELSLPVVCTVHGSDVSLYPQRSVAIRAATRWALRRVGSLIAVSSDLKTKICQLAGPREVTVAPNGADVSRFRPVPKSEARVRVGLPQDKRIVLYAGNFVPVKGLAYLLEAFAQLERADTILVMIGSGPLETELSEQTRRLDIAGRCVFAGRKPHDEMRLWLSASDCMVLPSLSEGLPTIVPEAMMCRAPVIATAVGGSPEIVQDGETGLLVPPRDAAALARAMRRVLDDPVLCDRLVQGGERIAQRFTWEGNARAMLAVYRKALRQTAPLSETSYSQSISG